MNQNRGTSPDAGPHLRPARPADAWLEAARSIPTPAHARPAPAPAGPAPAQPAAVPSATSQAGAGNGPARPVLVGAHGGAGATAWAGILDAVDGGNITTGDADPETAAVVLVLRASVDGVAAAKTALATHGADKFAAGLVVAAGPGRAPRRINDELTILAGALPLARTPWVPGLLLKRATSTAPTDLPAKELLKLTTTFVHHGVPTERETK